MNVSRQDDVDAKFDKHILEVLRQRALDVRLACAQHNTTRASIAATTRAAPRRTGRLIRGHHDWPMHPDGYPRRSIAIDGGQVSTDVLPHIRTVRKVVLLYARTQQRIMTPLGSNAHRTDENTRK